LRGPGTAARTSVDNRRRVCEYLFRAAVVPRDHRLLARFQQPDVLGQELGGAAPLGVGVVPLHVQGAQPALRVATVSPTTATPASIGTTALTPGSASAA